MAQVDHKISRLSDVTRLRMDDFQPLSKAANFDAKRQIVECRDTGKRFLNVWVIKSVRFVVMVNIMGHVLGVIGMTQSFSIKKSHATFQTHKKKHRVSRNVISFDTGVADPEFYKDYRWWF